VSEINELSVIIPNFNHGQVLRRSVASQLTQTRVPTEILIVDDCSTDDSVAVAKAICRENTRVRLIQRITRGGPNVAIASGLEQSKGDFVYFASADDFVDSDFASSAIDTLEKYPKAAFCFFDPSAFYEETGRFINIPLALAPTPKYFEPADIEVLFTRNDFTISSNTVVYRRSAISTIGGFLPELEWQADWFANLVLAFRHGICYHPGALAHFVIDPKSYGSKGVRSAKGQRRLLFTYLDALDGPFRDVASNFRTAGLLPEMRLRTLFWLLSEPRGRRFLTLRLAARLVRREVWTVLRPLTPIGVRRWMRRCSVGANGGK